MRGTIAKFISSELIPTWVDFQITDDVRLVSDGIIDSLASLRLVAFLEEEFGVSIGVNQVSAEYLDTVDLIVKTVLDAMNS